jgi:predicted peptidase
MKKRISILFCLLLSIGFVHAQDKSLFQKQFLINGSDTLPYRLLLPVDYNPAKKYPLILFLHGSGERGNDNELQLVHGSKLFLNDSLRKKYPAIVVFPQCPSNSFWSNVTINMNADSSRSFSFQIDEKPSLAMDLLQQLLKHLTQTYKLDKNRMYVGGLSMGGMGTFEIVARNPNLFAAAFPICGGGDSSTANGMKKVNWWIFHGAKDNVVLPKYSTEMVIALQKAKAKVKCTVYPEAGHNSWDNAFAEPDLLQWLFTSKRK